MAQETDQEFTEALTKASSEITKNVKNITEPLDNRLKQLEEMTRTGGSLDPALKSEVENLAKKHEEMVKSQEEFTKLMDEKLANLKALRNEPTLPQSLKAEIETVIKAKENGGSSVVDQIKDIAHRKAFTNQNSQIEINVKAVADMTVGTNVPTTGYFTGYDLRPGITVRPLFDPHLRALFPQNTTEKQTIRYIREVSTSGGPDMTAEAATKPQMDFKFDEIDANVRKIAGYFRISEEMIDDIPYLLTYLTGRGMENLKNVEDYQFLHGDGTGQNLTGLDSVATAFAAGPTITTAPNEFDVFVAAKKQLRNKYMMPTGVLVNPDDYASMRLRKTTQNEPLFPYLADMQTISVDGTPIVQNTRVASGSFYVMDARWIEVIDRMQSQIRLFDQDRDNAIKNMVTCVIEERLAMLIYRAECVIKGTFAAAITDLTS